MFQKKSNRLKTMLKRIITKFGNTEEKVGLHEGAKSLVSIDRSFNPELINEFKNENKQILNDFDDLLLKHRTGSNEATRESLRLLINLFVTNAAKKQTHIYFFLNKAFKENQILTEIVRTYRKNLRDTNSTVNGFFNIWTQQDIESNSEEFEDTLKKVKAKLANYLRDEETEIFKYYLKHNDIVKDPKYVKMAEDLNRQANYIDEDLTLDMEEDIFGEENQIDDIDLAIS